MTVRCELHCPKVRGAGLGLAAVVAAVVWVLAQVEVLLACLGAGCVVLFAGALVALRVWGPRVALVTVRTAEAVARQDQVLARMGQALPAAAQRRALEGVVVGVPGRATTAPVVCAAGPGTAAEAPGGTPDYARDR